MATKNKVKKSTGEISPSKLLETYRNLPPHERAFVQLMSVVYEPVSGTKALQALAAAKVTCDTGKPFDVSSYRRTLGKLLSTKLLTANRAMQAECNSLIVEVATRDAVREGRFSAMAEAALRVRGLTRSLRYTYFDNFEHAVRDFRLFFIDAIWKMRIPFWISFAKGMNGIAGRTTHYSL
jgi:hypothetical protein